MFMVVINLLVMRKETLLVAYPNSFSRDTEDFLRMTQEISFLEKNQPKQADVVNKPAGE